MTERTVSDPRIAEIRSSNFGSADFSTIRKQIDYPPESYRISSATFLEIVDLLTAIEERDVRIERLSSYWQVMWGDYEEDDRFGQFQTEAEALEFAHQIFGGLLIEPTGDAFRWCGQWRVTGSWGIEKIVVNPVSLDENLRRYHERYSDD